MEYLGPPGAGSQKSHSWSSGRERVLLSWEVLLSSAGTLSWEISVILGATWLVASCYCSCGALMPYTVCVHLPS